MTKYTQTFVMRPSSWTWPRWNVCPCGKRSRYLWLYKRHIERCEVWRRQARDQVHRGVS